MKKFIKRITALICAAAASSALVINANAASFFQPYGYSLPLETLANDSASLSSQNYISGLTGTASYDPQNGFFHSPSSDTGLFIILGGQGYSGETLTEAVSAGKLNTTITFSLAPSSNPNQPAKPVEWLDFRQYIKPVGQDYGVLGFKFYYNYGTYYEVNMDYLGGESMSVSKLYFGKFYTYTCEIDVTEGTVRQCFKDYETGNVLADRTLTGLNLEAARNGARARFFAMWEVGIKEFSVYREAFLIKNEQINADETTVTAQFDVANDCSENTAYGKVDAASPVLVLCQYDKNNRLLSYDTQKITLKPKALSATANTYETVTAEVEKSRYYDHAAAYIWNNEDDMFAYREPLTIR